MLPTANWFLKLEAKIVAEFLDTVKYVNGHLAHMEHGQIQSALSDSEFLEFLALVGTDKEQFDGYNGYACVGQIGARTCAQQPGYCNPQYCY